MTTIVEEIADLRNELAAIKQATSALQNELKASESKSAGNSGASLRSAATKQVPATTTTTATPAELPKARTCYFVGTDNRSSQHLQGNRSQQQLRQQQQQQRQPRLLLRLLSSRHLLVRRDFLLLILVVVCVCL
jgi:hypothetical protein